MNPAGQLEAAETQYGVVAADRHGASLGEEGAERCAQGKQGSPKGGRTLLGRLLFAFGAQKLNSGDC